jgi:LysR family glycine cleavage system transcriptional activator
MFVDEGGFDLAFRLRPATDRSGEPVNAEEDELIAVQKPETLGAPTQSDPFEGRVLLDDDCSRLGIEPGEHWVGWYRQNGYNRVNPRPEMTFNDASLMIEAAAAGAGVALARTLLVSESLASGRLIARGSGLRVNSRTMLIQRPSTRRSRLAQQVARWFLDAAGAA